MEKFKILLPQKKEKKTAIWGFNIKAKDLIMIIKKKKNNQSSFQANHSTSIPSISSMSIL